MYKHRDPIELRQEFDGIWAAQDRAWERQRDVCSCHQPRRGPSYFRQVRCTACGKKVP